MADLPKKKVGIVACSGEELAEGTVTRLAALKVLEQLRPADTVTICLPLFLAGGEGDRAFARFYPTIAIDGCDKRCAARATEMYSGKPAACIVVTELVAEAGLDQPAGLRRLNEAGQQAVDLTAARVVEIGGFDFWIAQWDRRAGAFAGESPTPAEDADASRRSLRCGSGIPVQKVDVQGQGVTLVGLPLIFQQFHEAGRRPRRASAAICWRRSRSTTRFRPTPRPTMPAALLREYAAYCAGQEVRP